MCFYLYVLIISDNSETVVPKQFGIDTSWQSHTIDFLITAKVLQLLWILSISAEALTALNKSFLMATNFASIYVSRLGGGRSSSVWGIQLMYNCNSPGWNVVCGYRKWIDTFEISEFNSVMDNCLNVDKFSGYSFKGTHDCKAFCFYFRNTLVTEDGVCFKWPIVGKVWDQN